MLLLLLSGILAVVPLLGIGYLWYVDPALTVDKVFMTLIALAISGVFALNAMLEMKRLVKGEEEQPSARGGGGSRSISVAAGASSSGAVKEKGTVQSVGYYESAVGRANHSIITLRVKGDQTRLVTLLGDLRDQFPVGKEVELVYRPDPQGFSLVERRIFA
ncbi:MAG TPA: hypothetical protein VFU76_12090 [Terriglobales bacterium]|nr:hypothetical protein [Terriglobales bacterium]